MSKEEETEGEAEKVDMCNEYDNNSVMICEDFGDNLIVIAQNPPRKIRACENNRRLDPSLNRFYDREGKIVGSSGVEPQDADYSNLPPLGDDVEVMILARVPISEYWKLYLLNKRYLSLSKSGDIFKIRRGIGFRESSVFMLANGDKRWSAFDRQFTYHRKLPEIPSDMCFSSGDKESLCAGTHLIVSGKEIGGVVIWRYELETNRWLKGPFMINPRCLFASASCGDFAFVAGGIRMEIGTGVLDTAERYNPDTKSWEPLRRMHRKRKLCSGCYMDNKFYVIGGRDDQGRYLTCGEAYDVDKSTWQLIPNMLEHIPAATYQSPPLVAVVNNELYSLETSSNELKVYLKSSNSWKKLGSVPVRADSNGGWGVAFKSLGNELLVIGASSVSARGDSMTIYTCCPKADAEELRWRPLECGKNRLSHFILNCSVMFA
ncbi:Kelch_1 domain-containing protein [Cephalotus follicularis]|uniref:Kelch_1 domain-containing protein n=1 Tax=Cephalotus follicularis TaxID=3775 RepID=A0A1Q3B8I8_CEPFO|nr:Kelch_1 domain-containing protein [Cephalotus follicularis]